MRQTPGFENAVAFDGSFERFPAGGHICKIMKAWVETTASGSEMLVLALDVDEGNFRGYFGRQFNEKRTSNPTAKWPCLFRQFTLGTDGQTNPYFKGLLKSIEESNTGYKWNWNEGSLANKRVGMIFREEEFKASDGTIKTTVRPAFARSVQRIRDGVPVPEIKRLNGNTSNAPGSSYDPFMGAQSNQQSDGFTDYSGKLPWEE